MPDESPLDELAVQLPGRLMAIEIVLVLLLRQKANAGRLLAGAETILSHLEANEMANGPDDAKDYALKCYATARESLDKMALEVRR